METLSMDYLKKHGYRILQRNFYTRNGEADIIATEDGTLCFVEVKYRRTNAFGTAAEAVTKTKQERLIKTAKVFILKNQRFADKNIRFDVLAIDGDKIDLIKGAFDAF